MADRSITHGNLWTWYREAEDLPSRRAEILHIFNLQKNLPNQTWKDQVIYLENCPEEIIKAHRKLLKPEARRKLGLEVSKQTEWMWNALS